MIAEYRPQVVWNSGEFGLFFRQPPGWTLSTAPISGRKKYKTRITCLACCNSYGSEMSFPLMMIGRSEQPRPFNGKYGDELGLYYHFNQKAWMENLFLSGSEGRIDISVGQTPEIYCCKPTNVQRMGRRGVYTSCSQLHRGTLSNA